jgi:hypothetical protein
MPGGNGQASLCISGCDQLEHPHELGNAIAVEFDSAAFVCHGR